tara:strand:+ start:93 stop:560 length:468 start_codon:yes stop_codon:yes gene_type:complete
MIKLKEILNEGKSVDAWVLVNGWLKAMEITKSMGAWSPHLRKRDKFDPVGYTNSDILDKLPKKFTDDDTWFAFHGQAMDSAMGGHNEWKNPMMLSWGGDGKLIVKILKKAGFKKIKGGKDTSKKIEIHPVGPKPFTDASVVPDGYSTARYPDGDR